MLIEEIETKIVRFLKERDHIIIPNYHLNSHECDLLVIRKTGFAIEIEIKRSVADMKNDLRKEHAHKSNKIVELYYAFPEEIAPSCLPLVPERAGIFVVRKRSQKASVLRSPKRNPNAVKWTEKEINKVLRYLVYRVWKLKRDLLKQKKYEKIKS